MAFLDADNTLVLEKDKWTVQKIVDGQIMRKPAIDVNVAKEVERCMCGIAVSKNNEVPKYVFLYFSEAIFKDGGEGIGNRVYRYEIVKGTIHEGKLIFDLPALPGSRHHGGAIMLGPNNDSLFVPIGDVDGSFNQVVSLLERWLRIMWIQALWMAAVGFSAVDLNGKPRRNKGILGDSYPLVLYYAYGIRNSFGMDFDPVTGNLWGTENGPDRFRRERKL